MCKFPYNLRVGKAISTHSQSDSHKGKTDDFDYKKQTSAWQN